MGYAFVTVDVDSFDDDVDDDERRENEIILTPVVDEEIKHEILLLDVVEVEE